jgi:GntR family transcriptional regulator
MLLRIDPQSSEPLFEQIAHAVKNAVARGDLAAGDKLPSVRELAQDLAINPNTVVRAYELLTRDGVVVRRQGAGCFVTGRPSNLSNRARRRQLDELIERTVTETFHLGFSAEEVREAFEEALAAVKFDERSGQKRTPATLQKEEG